MSVRTQINPPPSSSPSPSSSSPPPSSSSSSSSSVEGRLLHCSRGVSTFILLSVLGALLTLYYLHVGVSLLRTSTTLSYGHWRGRQMLVNRTRITDLPLILIWNTFSIPSRKSVLASCPHQCRMTTKRSLLDSAAAVVLHMRKLNVSGLPLPRRGQDRRRGQMWVFYMREPPTNQLPDFTALTASINWTMTYRLDSDIPAPYGILVHRENKDPLYNTLLMERKRAERARRLMGNVSEESDSDHHPALVSWMVSHCHTPSKRELLAQMLRDHIDIDIYGGCKFPGGMPCEKHYMARCLAMLERRHKFYLAFENSYCRDYVTEKLYRTLALDLVPIAYGGADYSRILPLQVAIDASKFDTSRHLADYLHLLDRNQTEYEKYLRWKDEYQVLYGRDVARVAFCQLCYKLHEMQGNTRHHHHQEYYKNITDWWYYHADGTSVCRRNTTLPRLMRSGRPTQPW